MRTFRWICTFFVLGCASLFASIVNIDVYSQASPANPADWAAWNNNYDNATGLGVARPNVVIPVLDDHWDSLQLSGGGNVPWISYDNTLCPACIPGFNPIDRPDFFGYWYPGQNLTFYNALAGDYVEFTQTFTIDPGFALLGGVLHVLADDSVTVIVNGTYSRLFNEGTGDPGRPFNYNLNSLSNGIPLADFASALHPGENTITFRVTNRDHDDIGHAGVDQFMNPTAANGGAASFGLSYLLTLQADDGTVPEPGTIVLMGLGLAGLAAFRFKRR